MSTCRAVLSRGQFTRLCSRKAKRDGYCAFHYRYGNQGHDVSTADADRERERSAVATEARRIQNLVEKAAPVLLAALEEARNGLLWYRDTYPEAVDGSDDEAMARIDAAIALAGGTT